MVVDRVLRRTIESARALPSRPGAVNIGVGVLLLGFAGVGYGTSVVAGQAVGDLGRFVDVGPYWIGFGVLTLMTGYGFVWYARHMDRRRKVTGLLGVAGGALTAFGAVVLVAAPLYGAMSMALGFLVNVVGVSTGTFEYTYRAYAGH